MAKAAVVHVFYFESRDAWAVVIDGLEGTVKSGQHATLTLEGEVAGPHRIRSVEMVDHRLERKAHVALMIQCARTRGLDRFVGGVVETTDLP